MSNNNIIEYEKFTTMMSKYTCESSHIDSKQSSIINNLNLSHCKDIYNILSKIWEHNNPMSAPPADCIRLFLISKSCDQYIKTPKVKEVRHLYKHYMGDSSYYNLIFNRLNENDKDNIVSCSWGCYTDTQKAIKEAYSQINT